MILVLFLVAWRRRQQADEGRAALLFAAVAAFAAATAAATAVTGPWRWALGGLALSVKALSKPLAIALYALILTAIASRSLRNAWRRGSVPAFYLLAAVAMMIFAFGPNPVAGELRVWDKAPYYYLLKLPGVWALRAPTRFAMPGFFCLALAGATMLGRLIEQRGRRGTVLVFLAAIGVLWDGWLDLITQQQQNEYLEERIRELESQLQRRDEEAVADEDLANLEDRLREERQATKQESPAQSKPWYARIGIWLIGLLLAAAAIVGWLFSRRAGGGGAVTAGPAESLRDIKHEAEDVLRVLADDRGQKPAAGAATDPLRRVSAGKEPGGDAGATETPAVQPPTRAGTDSDAELLDEDSSESGGAVH